MSEEIEDEGEVRGGRYYPKLGKAEREFIRKEAKRHHTTPNAMLEAMMLSFFKEKDQTIYEEAIEHASPEAMRLIRNAEAKELAEAKEIAKSVKIDEGDWWTHTDYSFYAIIKDGKITVPKDLMEAMNLKEDEMVSLVIEKA